MVEKNVLKLLKSSREMLSGKYPLKDWLMIWSHYCSILLRLISIIKLIVSKWQNDLSNRSIDSIWNHARFSFNYKLCPSIFLPVPLSITGTPNNESVKDVPMGSNSILFVKVYYYPPIPNYLTAFAAVNPYNLKESNAFLTIEMLTLVAPPIPSSSLRS